MDIDVKRGSGYCDIVIEGVIKSISDSQAIKDAVLSCSDAVTVRINVLDSFSITSSVIGFLLKRIQGDGINIEIEVHEPRLYELFENLKLIEMLNVRKV